MLLRFSNESEALSVGLVVSAALSLMMQMLFFMFSISVRMKMPALILIGLVSERVFSIYHDDSFLPSYSLTGRRFLVLSLLVVLTCSSGLQYFIQNMQQVLTQDVFITKRPIKDVFITARPIKDVFT